MLGLGFVNYTLSQARISEMGLSNQALPRVAPAGLNPGH